jgi:hypothetical protein
MSGQKQSGTRHLKGGHGLLPTINKPFYRVIALPPAGRVLPLRSLLVRESGHSVRQRESRSSVRRRRDGGRCH